MRPVVKYQVGIVCPSNNEEITISYVNYRNAKPFLEANLGPYCTYCERPISDESMHVEHIKPKAKFQNLETKWINFVVSCHRCNGTDNKGEKVPKLNSTHFPTVQNTFRSFVYHDDGRVLINNTLSLSEQTKADKLMNLVNLHLIKGDPNHKEMDKRYERRKSTFKLAIRYLQMWESNEITNPIIIIELAKERGHWSIWMQVFYKHLNIQMELIKAFKGTYEDCLLTDINRL
jgi:uncharacterized protein (TIGR02646 family)